MVIGTVGLSLVAFFAIAIGIGTGAAADDGFSRGIWPTVVILPLIALPIGFLLMIVLLVLSTIRRNREAKGK
ncbi:hypothetical protein B0I08_10776 [Glaciihabitans tibetensis]|uniref:Uncharacterized protein n=2 Tax=Glaciihabitans tibetensis TaxID=1266600 RepID=A0A2T0VAG7_9MICO|nr:hypothetical protein B0I08_10776 [Glaciihabitans tibetensis]